ncbi:MULTISPECIES: nuclear transport factor 2 family protein [unclassified Mycobacterium]|uniref:nuclear transport factor 2 family protein n=1 Tax=unclassified Mycobacterium TaxID=2642494 RepID=UPI0029C80AF1|nr:MULTISPECIES: nuclear transport factor 2 family protein [unclassified Mycobacterium]
MSADDNKKMVLSFFENLSAGRLDAALDLMDENAVWWVSGNPEYLPLAGTYRKDEIVGMVSMVGAAMPGGIRLTVTSSTAEDDRVAVETEVRGVSPKGKVYDNRNFFAVEVQNGRIRSVREYFDTIHTNEVLFDRTYSREGGADRDSAISAAERRP